MATDGGGILNGIWVFGLTGSQRLALPKRDSPQSPIINNSIISDNTAKHNGGGIYSYGEELVIGDSTISHNMAWNDGGYL